MRDPSFPLAAAPPFPGPEYIRRPRKREDKLMQSPTPTSSGFRGSRNPINPKPLYPKPSQGLQTGGWGWFRLQGFGFGCLGIREPNRQPRENMRGRRGCPLSTDEVCMLGAEQASRAAATTGGGTGSSGHPSVPH